MKILTPLMAFAIALFFIVPVTHAADNGLVPATGSETRGGLETGEERGGLETGDERGEGIRAGNGTTNGRDIVGQGHKQEGLDELIRDYESENRAREEMLFNQTVDALDVDVEYTGKEPTEPRVIVPKPTTIHANILPPQGVGWSLTGISKFNGVDLLRVKLTNGPPDATIDINVRNPSGAYVFQTTAKLDANGSLTEVFQIGQEVSAGDRANIILNGPAHLISYGTFLE